MNSVSDVSGFLIMIGGMGRKCVGCQKARALIDRRHWYVNRFTDVVLCQACYSRFSDVLFHLGF